MAVKGQYFSPNEKDERASLLHNAETRVPGRTRFLAKAGWCCVLLPVGLLLFLVIGHRTRSVNIATPQPTAIAIIGAGPGGVAAAYSLTLLAKAKAVPIKITVFEQKPAVGGRLVITDSVREDFIYPWNDHSQDPLQPEDIAGSSILYSSKAVQREAAKYNPEVLFHERTNEIGFFNGVKIVSRVTRPSSQTSLSAWLGQIFHYGPSVWRAPKVPAAAMSRFLKISNGFNSNFGTVNSLIDAVGLSYAVGDKASELLKLKGISETYVREVISPEVRRRFGQNIEELSELAISLALERSDQGDAYVGGRITQVLEDLMDQSAADFRFNTVAREFRHELMENGDMKWILEHRNQSSEALEYSMFDKVILSAPWNLASMAIESEEIGIRKASGYHEEVEYRTRHITFFTSPFGLSEDYFGTKSLPPTILLIPSKNDESLIDEISFVRELSRMVGEATVTEKLYRILSPRKVDDQTIRSLVGGDSEGVTWLHRDIIRDAYPLLHTRLTFPPIKMADGFWHASAIEAAASSVDLAWVSGENAARLLMADL